MSRGWPQVRVTDVQLPQGATFVIANSLAVSNKAETADKRWVAAVQYCLHVMLETLSLVPKVEHERNSQICKMTQHMQLPC